MANRPDHYGPHETEYKKNKQKILKTQDICAICGQPVDKALKFPNPYSASIDHIIPLNKGGHPSAMSNLVLTHLRCNRLKSDHLPNQPRRAKKIVSCPTIVVERKTLMGWA